MIYNGTFKAKTGDLIPLFTNGKPMHSKYNPQNENLSITQECNEGFFIVAGIGAGFHINNLLQKVSLAKIIAFEDDKESLNFCMQFSLTKELVNKTNIIFCTLEDLENKIISNYIPSVFGNLFFLPQRAWESENKKLCEEAKNIITKSLKSVSADYSVQSHFGKIWMRNILKNLSTFKSNQKIHFDINKTVAIIAAGPSLDKSIEQLKQNRNSYCIIATDTTYGSLVKNNIFPEVVVSVDAQYISSTHFYPCMYAAKNNNNTIFVFDICTNTQAVELVKKFGYKTFFIHNGHPLAQKVENFSSLVKIETGAGTVAIACCDFARRAGFRKIKLFGADFAYSSGKPYAKGTYLETQFLEKSNRTSTSEFLYCSLMYRTPLERLQSSSVFSGKLENPFTSKVLQSYEKTMIEWAKKYNYEHKGDYLELNINKKQENLFNDSCDKVFDFSSFIKNWLKSIENICDNKESILCNEDFYTLLPYIAFLRNRKNLKGESLYELLKLAYSYVSRYNRTI